MLFWLTPMNLMVSSIINFGSWDHPNSYVPLLCARYLFFVFFKLLFCLFVFCFLGQLCSLRKHPFLLALRRWGQTSPAAKSEEKRVFSQATSCGTPVWNVRKESQIILFHPPLTVMFSALSTRALSGYLVWSFSGPSSFPFSALTLLPGLFIVPLMSLLSRL